MNDDKPTIQKKSDKKKVTQQGETKSQPVGLTWKDILWRSRAKLKIWALIIISALGVFLMWHFVNWTLAASFLLPIIPAIFGLKRIIKVPTRLIMEYKRKLKHFNLYSVPNKLFKHFNIDPSSTKLTAGSNQFVFLCSDADMDNKKINTSWAATANPFDFQVDEDAYMELARRYEKMAEQDLANIAIPQAIGMEKARQNSQKLDQHDYDNLPDDSTELKKQRPTEAYDKLKDMKGDKGG